MPKDERYEMVKEMIENGRIQEFKQFTKYLPKTIVAHDIHTNSQRMSRLLNDPSQLKLEEVYEISGLFDVNVFVLFKLIDRQLYPNKILQQQ